MYITRHSNITERQIIEELWELYITSYERLAAVDITRETLYRSEFEDVLADPTNRVWVVRDENRPVSMALIATDIASTRYLSRAYFDRADPERMNAGLVHYIMWVVTHPEYQGGRATFELARGALAVEAREKALLVFDLPESNQPKPDGGGAELFYRLAQMIGDVSLQSHGGSRYYALDFAASDQPAASDPASVTSSETPADSEHSPA